VKNVCQKSDTEFLIIKLAPSKTNIIPVNALTAVDASSNNSASLTPFGTYGGEGWVAAAFLGSNGLPPAAGTKSAGFFILVNTCGLPLLAMSGSV